VLTGAIQAGVNSEEYFAIASGHDGTRYIDLKFNQFIDTVEKSGLLVKMDAARKQLADEEAKRQEEAARGGALPATPPISPNGDDDYVLTPPEPSGNTTVLRQVTQTNKRFFMSADLDTTRINRDVQNYVEEIIQHLTSVDGAQVRVSIEVEAETPDGFTQQTVRTISENCRTLRVRDSGFER
jgi:hypothetical protein